MTQESNRRTWSATAGCAALAATAVLLVLLGVGLWVNFAVPAFFDRPDIPAEERLAKRVGGSAYRLQEAARDGSLTDEEIAEAAGEDAKEWSVERGPKVTRVVASYEPGPTCYQFDVPLPLAPQAAVKGKRLDRCSDLSKKSA